MEVGKYTVYCHTNKINGKKYIGTTKQKPYKRWANGKGYRNQTRFCEAIAKYGWHNFQHEILYTGLSRKEAEKLEIELISYYKTADKEHGYNTDYGGISKRGFSDEHKKKISKASFGKTVSGETRAKMSKMMTGSGNPMYGKKRPIDIFKNRKMVMCVETGVIYESVNDASRKANVQQSDISKAVNGKLKTAGKFHWKIVEGGV